MASAASLYRIDPYTKGIWIGVYGSDGYRYPYALPELTPPYAVWSESSTAVEYFTWSSTDLRATEIPGQGYRSLFSWTGAFYWIDLDLAGEETRYFSLYVCDWEALGRVQTMEIVDADTSAVLDSRTVSDFSGGVWYTWAVTGHVRLVVTATGTGNATGSLATLGRPVTVSLNRFWVGHSGETLTVTTDDGVTYGPAQITAIPGPEPTITVDGVPVVPTGKIWVDPAKEENRKLPLATYQLPAAVMPGQVVRFSSAYGSYRSGTVAVEAVDNVLVANRSGVGILPDVPPAGRTLRVGMNVSVSSYWSPGTHQANRIKDGSQPAYAADPYNLAGGGFGADSIPRGSTQNFHSVLSLNGTLPAGMLHGYVYYDEGPLTLMWDRRDPGIPATLGIRGDVALVSGDIGRVTDNRRVYNLTWKAGTNNSYMIFDIDSNAANIRLFDATVTDVSNPPRFHPRTMSRLTAMRPAVIRDMQIVNAISGKGADPEDYPPAEATFYEAPFSTERFHLTTAVTIEDYPAGQPWSRYHTWSLRVKVTFSEPHNLKNGRVIELTQSNGAVVPLEMFDGTIGTTKRLGGYVYVLSPTEVVIDTHDSYHFAVAQPVPDGAFFVRSTGAPAPWDESVELAVAAGTGLWHNFPTPTTDESAGRFFGLALSRLPADAELWVEVSNEPWNPGFVAGTVLGQFVGEFAAERAVAGDDTWTAKGEEVGGQSYAAMRACQLKAIGRAAWQAAGRDPSLVKSVVNLQIGFVNRSLEVLNFCAVHDINGLPETDPAYAGPMPIDAIALAPYEGVTPYASPDDEALFAAVRVEQMMDHGEAAIECLPRSGVSATWTTALRDGLPAAYASKPWVCYEMAIGLLGLGGTYPTVFTRNMAMRLHPRMSRMVLGYFAAIESWGFSLANYYVFAGAIPSEAGYLSTYMIFTGHDQTAGVGDGSDGLNNNLTVMVDGATGLARPFALTGVVVPTARAVALWNAGDEPPPDPPPSPALRWAARLRA